MRKILFIILIVALLVFTGFTIYKGSNFANLDIWGFEQIRSKNDDIDKEIEELKNLIEVNYVSAEQKLENSSNKMQQTKKEYEEKALLLSQKSKNYNQKEKYKHEFLLTKIGDYAKDNNVDVKIVVTQSGISEYYNIAFTVTGKYSDVAGYIYDIENDSKLGFKIEDFSMVAAAATIQNEDGTTSTTNGVQGKFNCKEIAIELKSLNQTQVTTSYDSDVGQTRNNTSTERTTTSTTGTTSTPETTPTNSQSTPTTEQETTEDLEQTSEPTETADV